MSKRVRFFVGHLIISLIIALICMVWIFCVWYPLPLNKAVGVTHIFLMMMVIDVIMGPTLGFLVYKVGKKTLVMDLTIIVLLQLSALGYGLYNLAEGRPLWVVYNVDRFELVRQNEVYTEDKNIPQAYQRTPWLGPEYVATRFADTAEERSDDTLKEVIAGISLAQRPKSYTLLTNAKEQIKNRIKPLDELKKYNTSNAVDKLLKKYPNANGYLPLTASAVDMTVLMDKELNIVKIVDLRPW